MEEFGMLYHKGKLNQLFSWRVWTEEDVICTEYGTVEGKKQIARKRATVKNQGKVNETSPEEQAQLEAKAMWVFKRDRKYSETPEGAEQTLFLPMLAKKFEDRLKKIEWPVDVQPKFDGVRCLAAWEGDTVKLFSRSGKEYNLPHISRRLEGHMPKTHALDGEIYKHGMSFQQVTRLVKKERPGETDQLDYHVYDYIKRDNQDTDLCWEARRNQLTAYFNSLDENQKHNLLLVPSEEASNPEEVYTLQGKYVADGYEGAIVRMLGGYPYIFGYRSDGLLKVKTFSDEEFKVIGHTLGDGKFEGTPTWTCEMENGQTFRCLSKGTTEAREEMGVNAESYYGLMLKVRFFEKTEDGVPRFPIGIGFREPEDMDPKED